MIEISVTLADGMCFPMFVFIPTGGEIMRRLSLRREWSYGMSGSHPETMSPFMISYNTIVPNGTRIKLFKRSVEPILQYWRTDEFCDRLKNHFDNVENTRPVLIWINYNIFYKAKEPLCLFFFYKEKGKWLMMIKTTHSFDELEEAMSGEVFDVLGGVWDRFFELKEYYSLYD
jgi:hypothetical protein